MFQLDALRHDYPGMGAPFLETFRGTGISGPLQPTFGFEPDFAYLAGLYPDEADGGAQFWRSPATSPFRFARWLPGWLDRLPRIPAKVLRKGIQAVARRRSPAPMLSPAFIPLGLLPEFDLVIQCPQDEPGSCPEPSVFDLLRAAGRRWLVHWAPRWRVEMGAAVERARSDLKAPLDFAFFHIGNLDRIGHRFGPGSPELRAELQRVDAGVREICELARQRFETVDVVILGDHGMAEVTSQVNVAAAVARLPWRAGQDYVMFLDSTMARFWFPNPAARRDIETALSGLPGGRLLNEADRARYHLNYRHDRFGQAIYLVDGGGLVGPNFYQRGETIRGMHGYAPEFPDQHSWFGVLSSRVTQPREFTEPQDMRRIFSTTVDLLGLELPSQRRPLESLL